MATKVNYIIDPDFPEIPDGYTGDEENSNLPEAPLSINIGSYYRGFYIGWTKRSADNEVSSKIHQTKKFVDSLIDEGFEPSWNKETSKKALAPADPIMEATGDVDTGNGHPCKTCGAKTEYKSGISKKEGHKPWAAYFCTANSDHVDFVSLKKAVPAPAPDYGL